LLTGMGERKKDYPHKILGEAFQGKSIERSREKNAKNDSLQIVQSSSDSFRRAFTNQVLLEELGIAISKGDSCSQPLIK